MARRTRKRVQTWPMKYVNQATIIKSQNELLLLDLLIDYNQLQRSEFNRLKDDLPNLKKLVGIIYQAAEQIDDEFSHKSPVWFSVSLKIGRDYPDTRTRLSTIEQRLASVTNPSGHLLGEICKDLVLIINKVVEVHVDILRIPIPENPDTEDRESSEKSAILDINSLNLIIRNHGELKSPNP